MQRPAKTQHQKLHDLEEGRCGTIVVRGVCEVDAFEVTARRLTYSERICWISSGGGPSMG